jgi:hypothetical protein
MGRDSKFTDAFRVFFDREGVKPVVLPSRSPILNSHLERFFGSLKRECVDRMIFFGEGSLRHAIRSYLEHYHGERNHQGLGNRLSESEETTAESPVRNLVSSLRLQRYVGLGAAQVCWSMRSDAMSSEGTPRASRTGESHR